MRYALPTMKRAIFFFTVGLLVLGAGCANTNSESTPPMSSGQEQATAAVPSSDAMEGDNSMNENESMQNANLAFPGVLPREETNKNVRIKTNKGEILIELLPDEGPNAASNFVYLIKQGYYDGLIFHRYVPDFVIQGGDPTGTGFSGPGYQFADDPVRPADENPYMEMRGGRYTYLKGTVAMANSGPNTNGSQFFIMNADAPMVGPDYSIFGHVIEGIDVVEHLRANDTMESVTLEDK